MTTSRRGELLRTTAVQACLNALQPSGISLYVAGDAERQNGVFLESENVIVHDSYWTEAVGEQEHKVRRRVIVTVECHEHVIDALT